MGANLVTMLIILFSTSAFAGIKSPTLIVWCEMQDGSGQKEYSIAKFAKIENGILYGYHSASHRPESLAFSKPANGCSISINTPD